MHVTLPVTCSLKSGEECNDFVCDSGYEKNSNVTSLTCTDSGVWSHNLSTICIGQYSYHLQFVLDNTVNIYNSCWSIQILFTICIDQKSHCLICVLVSTPALCIG